MNGDPTAINYSRELGWFGQIAALLGADPEPSIVHVTYNFDGGHEIGRYETTLTHEEFRITRERVQRSGYDQLPFPDPVEPETSFVDIGVRRASEALPTLRGFPSSQLPPAVAALRDDLEAGVIAKIRQHRSNVVSAVAAWQKPSFSPSEALGIAVQLECTGPLPVTVSNPLARAPQGSDLMLSIRTGDGSVSTVDTNELTLRLLATAPRGPELTLTPGKKLSFSIEKRVYLPPGTYEGHLMYRSSVDHKKSPQLVSGTLSMPLGPLTIEAKRW
jgi:hypothetical protein